ncbi:YgaP family membrane protein [Flavobacterium terrigena]|uniref:Inner membrane protein YgaP-like transmembrane domain-containing protein n=1 Tax=Flavobacterium terrigena TaxID=402734 RepID=A0A1H6QI63_9FLAO|nr:DUF2892 domain-containing protein [Flavobacterium terrigena]SEI40644.1 Protein of unknown function [Flavobacterium terrigena]
MKKNMGSLDTMIRIVIAIIIGALYFTTTITGTLAIIALVIAVIFVITGFIGFCPLYALLGINTLKK